MTDRVLEGGSTTRILEGGTTIRILEGLITDIITAGRKILSSRDSAKILNQSD